MVDGESREEEEGELDQGGRSTKSRKESRELTRSRFCCWLGC